MRPPLVIALGGNALSPAGERDSIENQFAHTTSTARTLVDLIAQGENILVTHGNGPQVGNIVTRVKLARKVTPWLPLDICVADTQGGMGYMIQQCLQNALAERQLSRPVVSVVTQVLTDPTDRAFVEPSKPIGPQKTLVASPKPLEVIEAGPIKTLMRSGCVVIAAGGGGVPVTRTETGLKGVEAVIDKDLTSAILAEAIGARGLAILTDAEGIYRHFSTPNAEIIRTISSHELRGMMPELAEGTIRPKAQAACDFVDRGGAFSVIARIDHLSSALRGTAGTLVTSDSESPGPF